MIPLVWTLAAFGSDEALRRVAVSQERSIEARRTYVYRQEVRARLIRANGRCAREERHVYDVAPTENGTSKTLVEFQGWYEDKGERVAYHTPGFERKEMDIDAELIRDLVKDLIHTQSRDGIDRHLFPLTREEQSGYDFRLEGNRLKYEPKGNRFNWRGEMILDAEEGLPSAVTTSLARKVPVWVRVGFGTNFHQLGFSVTYRKVEDGLWFPASFGTEFRMRILFGYARTVTISVVNSDFRKALAESNIRYER